MAKGMILAAGQGSRLSTLGCPLAPVKWKALLRSTAIFGLFSLSAVSVACGATSSASAENSSFILRILCG